MGRGAPITHINPDTMHKNPVFSQAILVAGGKTLYIGGQNGVSQKNVVKMTIYVDELKAAMAGKVLGIGLLNLSWSN